MDTETVIEQWARERPELDMTPMRTLHPIWVVVETLVRARTALLKGYGLSMASLDVLAALRRTGTPYRVTPTELAQAAMITTGAMTPRLDRLEAAGHIRRVANPMDRRGLYAELTEQGLALIDEVIEAFAKQETEFVSQLSESDQDHLQQLTHQLLRSITEA